ncbi:TonB family protein [Paraburkholderia sp. DGU8]|uniref:TonB family protein n=1 Tax=Paraburkholderia sp. DGU8 TaxID=3161997 RepID=UPI0034651BB6
MSSLPTAAQHAPHPGTRKPIYMSATLALAVEALLLAGVGAWLTHPRISAPSRHEPMTITLAPPAAQAPKPAPIVGREASKPVPKPAVQPRRAPAVHQARIAHAPPQPQPQPIMPPPAPIPAPNTAPTPTPAAAAAPAPAPRPAPAPVLAPAPPDASFEAALRAAIEAALRYPESARMEAISGRTLVGFVYHDGAMSEIHVVTSSGIGLLDHAALAAVRDAVCPPPPHGLEGKSLPEQLWVDFTLDSKG